MRLIGVLTIITIFTFQDALCARILVLLPFTGKSHYLNIQPIVRELANRGHDLTVVATYEDKGANYTQLLLKKRMMWEKLGEKPDIFALETLSFKGTLDLVWNGAYFTTEAAFNDSVLQKFIKEDKSHFDLVITELFFQESMYMFAHKYKAPMIGISTMGYTQYIGDMMGSPIIPSYMTHEFLIYGHPLTFFQRLKNIHDTLYDFVWRRYYLLPMHQKLAEKNFPDLPKPLPQLTDLEKQFTAVLINTHFSNDIVRPYVPGIIEIGGVHIKKPKPLPEDIQKFLDGAENGAIFFSFGSNLQCKDMPKEKSKIFLNVFRKLKQRVLWKWEDDNIEDKPDNVMIGEWLPQNDILAHPNVKVFITHGGLLSTQEAMYNGVPVIGFPFYGDQHLNTARIEQVGFGKKLKFLTVTEQVLTDALKELIENPEYGKRAKSLSERFKDRPMSAMDTAIYWIEYTIRHKGADFMRSPALDMSVYVYLMMDILLFFALAASVFALLLYVLVKALTKSKDKDIKFANGKKYK